MHRPTRRLTRRVWAAVGLSLAMLAPATATAAPPAPARPAAPLNPATTPYGGGGTAEHLDIIAAQLGTASLADVGLSHSYAQVDSRGIGGGADRSAASGLQADPLEALGLDLDVLADSVQSAPPDAGAPAEDISIDLDGGPILDVGVAETLARARWAGDSLCVTPGEPISLGRVQTAGATVLGEGGILTLLDLQSILDMLDSLNLFPALGDFLDTGVVSDLLRDLGLSVVADLLDTLGLQAALDALGIGLSGLTQLLIPAVDTVEELLQLLGLVDLTALGDLIIDLVNSLSPQLGALVEALLRGSVLEIGAVITEVTVTLVEAPGLAPGHYALETQSTTTLSDISLLGGLLEIGIADEIQATALAAGNSSSSATVDIPLLEVSLLGSAPIEVPADAIAPLADVVNGVSDLLSSIGLDAVLDLGLSIADQTTNLGPNGTTASASGHLLGLNVELLGITLADVIVAPVTADAAVPAGGVNCNGDDENPLRELNKHASATEVPPGGTFEYNISVPNRGPCALTDVVVTDVVTGPGRIVATEPSANVSSDGKTATWNVGNLAVNETVNLTITVLVDDDAQNGATFDDDVHARGNCDGREVEEDDELDDIPTVTDTFDGPCNVQYSNKDASHLEVMPGQTFSYYVHAYNTGGEPCTDVDIVDTLDDRLSFVSCNKGCTNQGQTVRWNLDSIAGGSSVILSVVVQVDDDATGTLANVAVIDPGNGDPTTVRTTGPVISLTSIIKDPTPASRGPGNLPRTGMAPQAGIALLMAAGAIGLYALRRRATSIA